MGKEADRPFDESIKPMDKWKEYQVVRESRATAGACGDFWEWLAEAYPRKTQAAISSAKVDGEESVSVSPAPIVDEPLARAEPSAANFGWNDVVAELNRSTHADRERFANGTPRDKSTPPINASNATQSDHGWGEVVAQVNAENMGRR